MKNWKVKCSSSTVEFVLDGKFATIGKMVDKANAIYITDENVYALHQQIFKGKPTIVMPAGEAHKQQATVDFMIAMMSSEELEGLNQIMFKQLKNRYADPTYMKRFVVGIDKAKMRLFNAEQSAQHDIVDDSASHNLSMDKKFSKETFKGFS